MKFNYQFYSPSLQKTVAIHGNTDNDKVGLHYIGEVEEGTGCRSARATSFGIYTVEYEAVPNPAQAGVVESRQVHKLLELTKAHHHFLAFDIRDIIGRHEALYRKAEEQHNRLSLDAIMATGDQQASLKATISQLTPILVRSLFEARQAKGVLAVLDYGVADRS